NSGSEATHAPGEVSSPTADRPASDVRHSFRVEAESASASDGISASDGPMGMAQEQTGAAVDLFPARRTTLQGPVEVTGSANIGSTSRVSAKPPTDAEPETEPAIESPATVPSNAPSPGSSKWTPSVVRRTCSSG